MANEHVEIHNPFSDHNGLNSSADADPESPSDSMEDTLEFRLLMAYAQRRRPHKESPTQDGQVLVTGGTDANASPSPQTPAKIEKEEEEEVEEKKKKKKKKKMRRMMKGWKRMSSIFSCIKPQTMDGKPCPIDEQPFDVSDRCGDLIDVSVEENDELTELARRLTKLADEIPFIPPEVETDSPEDVNVERMIGLLLRDAGDRLHEKELKDAAITTELFWNYSFFKLLMTTLLTRMGLRTPNPDSPGPKASPKTQIAVTCEVISRLSAVNSLPRTRVVDHGARYLQHYYSSWVQQQGGYEEAFYSDDEDDVE